MSSPQNPEHDLPLVLAALDNPHRLRIIAALRDKNNYVSQLARDLNISRPLLIMHLKKLEDAGLVSSGLEVSQDGKAMRVYQLENFDIRLTPNEIAKAAANLPPG
ncbi:MAG: winged helix-turn-helix transcriptional regulator [Anaerolineales bacterium]|nr:MAG: winged helix-turn-helix transcriptional regulator [Anaerolineales bacterium]